jgi:hypothetical protein
MTLGTSRPRHHETGARQRPAARTLSDFPIITGPRQATARWLTAALTGSGAVPPGARVIKVTAEPLGSGKAGECARLRLAWAGASGAGLPTSVVAKFPSRHARTRRAGQASGAYLREVAFYRELAGRAGISVPDCYVAAADPRTSEFVLLLSDLGPVGAQDQVAGGSAGDIALALRAAARLHARFWNGAGVTSQHWLWSQGRRDSRRFGAAYRLLVPGFLARFGGQLSDATRSSLTRLNTEVRSWMRADSPPMTILHGDFRLDNLVFSDAVPVAGVTVIDWQTVTVGCGARDAAYLVGGSLTTETRRANEPGLFELYYEALSARGVAQRRADCWRSYRASTLAGLQMTVVGAMLVEPDALTDEMFRVLAERHAAHAADLGAFAAINRDG